MKKIYRNIIVTVAVLALLSGIGVLLCILLKETWEKDPPENSAVNVISLDTTTASAGVSPGSVSAQDAEGFKDKTDISSASGSEASSENPGEASTETSTETSTEASASTEASTETSAQQEAPEPEDPSEKVWEDLAAPVFVSFKSPEIKVGNSFDIHKYIGYADDVDREVDLKVEGKVDTSKVGTYTLNLTITDDTGKSTVKKMDVKVVNELSKSSGGSEKEQFSDFVKNYKTDETMVGIDVSRWQMDVNYDKVKAAGCEFVMIRIGGFDSGDFFVDKSYANNIRDAKAAGLKVGLYWYGEEGSPEQVKRSVQYLMDILKGESLDLPIAYNWEDYRNFENYGMNLHDLNICYETFEQEIEKHGYMACLYASAGSHNRYWTHEKKNPVWMAHYAKETNYPGNYFMWQHSSAGRIDGINGDVDLDVFYPDKMKDWK